MQDHPKFGLLLRIDALDMHASLSDTPELEEVEENIDSLEEVSEELTGSFPGGPYDISILRCFKTHMVADIWNQKVIIFA